MAMILITKRYCKNHKPEMTNKKKLKLPRAPLPKQRSEPFKLKPKAKPKHRSDYKDKGGYWDYPNG